MSPQKDDPEHMEKRKIGYVNQRHSPDIICFYSRERICGNRTHNDREVCSIFREPGNHASEGH